MDKVLSEKASMKVGDYEDQSISHLIKFTEIDKHLSEGWTIKQMFVTPYGVNKDNATDLVITVHLQRI